MGLLFLQPQEQRKSLRLRRGRKRAATTNGSKPHLNLSFVCVFRESTLSQTELFNVKKPVRVQSYDEPRTTQTLTDSVTDYPVLLTHRICGGRAEGDRRESKAGKEKTREIKSERLWELRVGRDNDLCEESQQCAVKLNIGSCRVWAGCGSEVMVWVRGGVADGGEGGGCRLWDLQIFLS